MHFVDVVRFWGLYPMVIPNTSSKPVDVTIWLYRLSRVGPSMIPFYPRPLPIQKNILCCVLGPGMLVIFLVCRGTFSGKMFGLRMWAKSSSIVVCLNVSHFGSILGLKGRKLSERAVVYLQCGPFCRPSFGQQLSIFFCWSGVPTLAAQTPFAASLIFQDPASQTILEGDLPSLSPNLLHFSH